MSDVNWDSVGPQKQAEQQQSGGPLGTIVFIVLLVLGLGAGAAYVNTLLLASRVRDIVADACKESTCRVDVQLAHSTCFEENVSYHAPTSLGDFQTPNNSPKLGIGSVDLAGYKACVRPKKVKTLAESDSK